MKRFINLIVLLLAVLLSILFAACGQAEPAPAEPSPSESSVESSASDIIAPAPPAQSAETSESSQPDPAPQNTAEDRMYILIGQQSLTVEMADNSSAQALLELLKDGDITVAAHDYGNFEKVGPLGVELPTNDEQITTEPGDVILYQGDQITVYYDTNSWSFTRLGKVQGLSAEELKALLGDGDVTMILSLKGPESPAENKE